MPDHRADRRWVFWLVCFLFSFGFGPELQFPPHKHTRPPSEMKEALLNKQILFILLKDFLSVFRVKFISAICHDAVTVIFLWVPRFCLPFLFKELGGTRKRARWRKQLPFCLTLFSTSFQHGCCFESDFGEEI